MTASGTTNENESEQAIKRVILQVSKSNKTPI